jgi:hypothetical protein
MEMKCQNKNTRMLERLNTHIGIVGTLRIEENSEEGSEEGGIFLGGTVTNTNVNTHYEAKTD